MLQFWCLSPVRVAYHGSCRENLESSFWNILGLWSVRAELDETDASLQKRSLWNVAVLMPLPSQSGLSRFIWRETGISILEHFGALEYHIRAWWNRCKSSETGPLKCCSLEASLQSEWNITAHLERISNQHFATFWGFGMSDQSLMRQMQVFRNGAFEMLQFWWLSPVRVAYHGSFRENLESSFCSILWTFWGFGVSDQSLMNQMQVFGNATSEMLQFWCLSPVRVAYHGSFGERLESAFWNILGLWNIISELDETDANLQKRGLWNVAVWKPLSSQSGISRLI